jgi:hypothetical protein
VQTSPNAKTAKRFFARLIVEFGEPRVVVTDKLRGYIKPIMAQAPSADHHAHKGLNNATEVSHRPTRKREKMFGHLKDWRRLATRYNRNSKGFFSAIALAATVIFWLCVQSLNYRRCAAPMAVERPLRKERSLNLDINNTSSTSD